MELLLEAYIKRETNAAFCAERHWAGPGDSGDHSSGDWVPHRGCDRSPLRAGEVFPPPGRLAPAVRPHRSRPARRLQLHRDRAREPHSGRGADQQEVSIPAGLDAIFNPAAFGVPALLTFGNEPRALDHARTFAGKNEDFTLAKRTALYNERVYLDFRAEFFNLFNRHVYDAPNGFATPLGSP